MAPFAGLALAIAVGWPPQVAVTALQNLVFYGAVILSFMGGVQWGLALGPAGEPAHLARRLVVSVLPAIAAWLSLAFLPTMAAAAVLAAAFALLLAYDVATVRRGLAPAWYAPLRAALSAAVIVCLLIPILKLAF